MFCRKIFDKDGKYTLRFGKDDITNIMKWLDGEDFNDAVKYAKKLNCDPVFGEVYEFPCSIKKE